MIGALPSDSSDYQLLCRVLGGQDRAALGRCVAAGNFSALFAVAEALDVLPALAIRCAEQGLDEGVTGAGRAALLQQALVDNTRRNMSMVAQSLKLAGAINAAGMTPLFLKGTARLLVAEGANLGFRRQVDIDLIVRPGDLVAAGEALLADGYRFGEVSAEDHVVTPVVMTAARAAEKSAAHHHLPPLVKEGYAATVELHRHYLPGRFQRANPVDSLFDCAGSVERNGVEFLVPSADYQLVHIVLGKLVNDGHLARRSFPVREACDLAELLESAREDLDPEFLAQRCGKRFARVCSLVAELTGYRTAIAGDEGRAARRYLRLMQKRNDSPVMRKLLDTYARAEYLAYEMAYSPGKLPTFLGRLFSPVR